MGNPFAEHDWHRTDNRRDGGYESWKPGRLSACFGGLLAGVALILLILAARTGPVMTASGLVGAAAGLLGAMALWRFRADPPGAGWWFLALGAIWVSVWPVAQGFGITALFMH
jgi:hypothetical protein